MKYFTDKKCAQRPDLIRPSSVESKLKQEALVEQRKSILATLQNKVIATLTGLGIELPVELPVLPYSKDLNAQFVSGNGEMILTSFHSFFSPEDVGVDPKLFEGTKGGHSDLDSLYSIASRIYRNETILAEYSAQHTEVNVQAIGEELDVHIDRAWQCFSRMKIDVPETAALLEVLIPSKEAFDAVMKKKAEQYENASGLRNVDEVRMQVIYSALEMVLEVTTLAEMERDEITPSSFSDALSNKVLDVDSFETFFAKGHKLMTALYDFEKEGNAARLRCSEKELVERKVSEVSEIPVSEKLKYSLQVIAYNEMPNTPGVSFELPNLALQLQSIITAVKRYVQEGRGSAGEMEVLYNINNNPGRKTVGNERSLALLQGIVGDMPTDALLDTFDWVPTPNASYQGVDPERAEGVRLFYKRLIDDARELMKDGFHIVPINCTDGAFISRKGDAAPAETDLRSPSQGSRRMLVTEVGVARMRQASQKDQYIAQLDADILLTPTYFTQYDEMIKEHNAPDILMTSPRFKEIKGFYSLDLRKPVTKDGVPVIESFTKDQLELLTKTTIQEIGKTPEAQRAFLLEKGFSPEQISFLFSLPAETMEKVSGAQRNESAYVPFAMEARTIKIFSSGENQTMQTRRYNYYRDFDAALEQIKALSGSSGIERIISSAARTLGFAQGKEVRGTVAFLSVHLIKREAYERSQKWDITKDLGEDSAFLKGVKSMKGVRFETEARDVLRIRDRVREESWMGGDVQRREGTRTEEFPKGNWKEICAHLQRKFQLTEEQVRPDTLPVTLFTILLDRKKVKLSEKEYALVEEMLNRVTLQEVAKEGTSLFVMNMVELLRTIIQSPSEYRKLVDFFVPIASLVKENKTESPITKLKARLGLKTKKAA